MMTPQPGDVLIDRYELVRALRREPGIEAWRANDHVLARDCQLFIVTDPASASRVSALASALALSKSPRFTPVFQMHSIDDVALLITDLDAGICLTDYLNGPHRDTLSLDAMRVILGESALALQMLISQRLADRAVTTDVIRLDRKGISIADAPVSPAMIGPLVHPDDPQDTAEALAVRQLAAVLYAMLTREPYEPDQTYPADKLIAVQDKPHDFWIICQRGLGLPNPDGSTPTPIYTLNELIALLGYWKPLNELTERDIVWSTIPDEASIIIGQIRPVDPEALLTLPDGVIKRPEDPSTRAKKPVWDANQLLFPERGEVEMIKPQHHGDGDFLSVLGDSAASVMPVSRPTQAVDVSAIRPIQIKDISVSPLPPVELTGYSHSRHDDATPIKPTISDSAAASTEDAGTAANADEHRSEGLSHLVGTGSAASAASEPNHLAYLASSGKSVASEETRIQEPVAVDPPVQPLHVESAPPSFTPGEYGNHGGGTAAAGGTAGASADDISNDSNSYVFGRIRTRSFAIALGSIVLIIALVLSMNYLVNTSFGSFGFSDPQPGQWPTDLASARFDGRVSPEASSSTSAGASASASDSASTNDSASGSTETAVDHEDRNVSSVPTPAPVPTPTNTTAYPITTQSFLSRPTGLNGYGRYIQLDAPHDVYRVDFQIRQTSGSGQVFVNSNAQNPNNGTAVGSFTVDEQGNASVTFDQPVNTQEIVIWFPTQTLPSGGRLTFKSVSVF
ncbi:hypothetical protein [Bifidobacterium avesanii]|uniref:Uncharacterized protein n=1 Tax=Bifidobacterium avesanii TaxID=1798157 RepID=A0A7K3THU9_9BIFI|nr:hypothetical protein [Bifidobacterium avesanii]KAB8291996.1 hypothetical protein DSM100685_1008 [Bifidobacterium avesanii]NEG78641.1 hypothetical protein [Bifidobacterium avesanii]